MDDIKFNLTQVAQMTMLTERTLHNYMKRGLLHGEKNTSGWQFTSELLSPDLCEKLLHISHSYPLVRMAYYQEKSSARLTLCGNASQVTAFFAELQAAK